MKYIVMMRFPNNELHTRNPMSFFNLPFSGACLYFLLSLLSPHLGTNVACPTYLRVCQYNSPCALTLNIHLHFKGTVHPKRFTFLSLMHPHIIFKPHEPLSFIEHQNILRIFSTNHTRTGDLTQNND